MVTTIYRLRFFPRSSHEAHCLKFIALSIKSLLQYVYVKYLLIFIYTVWTVLPPSLCRQDVLTQRPDELGVEHIANMSFYGIID